MKICEAATEAFDQIAIKYTDPEFDAPGSAAYRYSMSKTGLVFR
jgi:hypothetical protein